MTWNTCILCTDLCIMQDLMLLNKEISSCFLFAQEKNAHRVKKSLWQWWEQDTRPRAPGPKWVRQRNSHEEWCWLWHGPGNVVIALRSLVCLTSKGRGIGAQITFLELVSKENCTRRTLPGKLTLWRFEQLSWLCLGTGERSSQCGFLCLALTPPHKIFCITKCLHRMAWQRHGWFWWQVMGCFPSRDCMSYTILSKHSYVWPLEREIKQS